MELPQELMTSEILPKLPIKSLIRFKSVSKHWNSLISSLQFTKHQLKFQHSSSNPNQNLLIYDNNSSFLTFDLNPYDNNDQVSTFCGFDPKPDDTPHRKDELVEIPLGSFLLDQFNLVDGRLGVNIIGSCDGLVCVYVGLDSLVVWNPATRETREIMNPKSFKKKETIFGFGYVSSLDDYKIVCLSQKMNSSRKKAHSLCLKGGEWGEVDVLDGYNVDSLTRPGVVVGEMVFWRMINGVGVLCIVGFDLVGDCFREVEMPEWIETLRDFFVCLIGGCLCACWKDGEGRVEVAMLKEYGVWGSWVKLYSFDCERFYCSNLFGFTRGGRLVMDDTLEGSVLFVDDLDKEVPNFVEILRLATHKDVVNYVESFVSPFGLVGA